MLGTLHGTERILAERLTVPAWDLGAHCTAGHEDKLHCICDRYRFIVTNGQTVNDLDTNGRRLVLYSWDLSVLLSLLN